jgi:putative transposase
MPLPHAHSVSATKFGRKPFTDPMPTFTETTTRPVCTEPAVELIESTSESDHLHLLVTYPPSPALSALTQRLQGRTAHAIQRELTGAYIRAYIRGHPWSPSYFTVSCTGAPPSITKQHIDGQARPL